MIERHVVPEGTRLHPLRPHFLNASEIGAATGCDPHKTPLGLWAEKSGLLPPQDDNPLMRRGRLYEPVAVAMLREDYPDWDIRHPLKLYLCSTTARLGCTPDAVAGIDGELVNIQIKVVARPEFAKHWADGPPPAYERQTLCEGMLMDADRSLIAALVVGDYSNNLHLFEVPRHAGAERRLHDIAAIFWDRVNTGKRPPADVTRDAETVAAMFPVSQPEPVLDLSGDNRLISLLPKRDTLKRVAARADKRLTAIDDEIKCKLNEAESAVLPGWKISWKTQHRAEHVVAASTFRKLLVSEVKEEAT